MSTVTLNSLMSQIKTLSIADQRALNKLLCANLKAAMKVAAVGKAITFDIGDKVVFDAKTRGIINAEIIGFSRDLSKIKCKQIGGLRPGCLWTVTANLVTTAKALTAALPK
jgi:hypothetical protein